MATCSPPSSRAPSFLPSVRSVLTKAATFALALGSALAILWASPASAQSIVIDVAGSADVPLAIPKPQLPAGNGQAEADEAHSAMWLDLQMSGYFKMQDPGSYVEKGKGVEQGSFEFSAWEMIRTAVLVKTRLYGPGSADCDSGGQRICVDLFVYHVPSQQQLAVKRFRGSSGASRHLGHAMANHVLEVITGTRGWFGTRLAAVGSQSGNKEIYVLDTDGKGVQAVTRNGAINLSPAWSPDGGEIAWTSYKKANPDLYVKDLASGRTRTLSNVKGVNTSPTFSPNGQHLALSRSVEGDADIFVLDVRTGAHVRRVTTGGGIDVSPSFSPDGATMVFASERSGGSQIYRTPTDGGETKRLTFTGDFNIDPVISPDGTKIAYVGRSEGGFDIYVSDIEGRNVVRLTQDMADNEDPTWSPDSRYVVFSSTRNGPSELWISTADGRHQTQITRGGGWTQPSWMPLR